MSDSLQETAQRMKDARAKGGFYHKTNPMDAWFCPPCGVFGRGETECWACGSREINWQVVPRFDGGTQNASNVVQ